VRTRKRLRVVYGETDLSKVGFTRDVSAGGMFVICNGPLPSGNRLHIQVFLNDKDFLLLEGAQVYKKQVPLGLRTSGEQGFGVRFLLPMEALARVTPAEQAASAASGSVPTAPQQPIFTAEYTTLEDLAAGWQRELRHGGLHVPADRALERDQAVAIQLRLPFAALTLEVAGKVLQSTSAPGGALGLVLVFTEPRRVLQLLGSFVR
jgi:hypothetical protein